MSLGTMIQNMAADAKAAARTLRAVGSPQKDHALALMAEALIKRQD